MWSEAIVEVEVSAQPGDPLDEPPRQEPFAIREASLPPPRTGRTVQAPFPPEGKAEKPDAAQSDPLEALRRLPEGEVPLAPHLSVTFSQPMVALDSHECLASLAAEGLPVGFAVAGGYSGRALTQDDLVDLRSGSPRHTMGAEARMNRSWKVVAHVVLPRVFDGPAFPLPERLTFRSMVPTLLRIERDGLTFELVVADRDATVADFPMLEIASLGTIVRAETPDVAIAKATLTMESLIDFLALQVQQPIPIQQLEARDVTPPIVAGQERDVLFYPNFAFPKFQRTVHLGPAALAPLFALDPPERWDEGRARAARDWYIKGLAAGSDADRFMLFWISMEILFDGSGLVVLDPPRCTNGHVLPAQTCPECGRLNEKMARGSSIKKFLVDRGGVSEDQAQALWDLRQIFHGKTLNRDRLADLSRLTILIQVVALNLLKAETGLSSVAPALSVGGSSILNLGFGGTTPATDEDV